MNNNTDNRSANPGILIMALLLVLLALVVVLVAVILATSTGTPNDKEGPVDNGGTTTVKNIMNSSSTPGTTIPVDPTTTTTQNSEGGTNTPNTGNGTTTGNNPPVTAPNTGNTTPSTGANIVKVNSSSTNKGALILVNNNKLISYRDKFPARSALIGNTELQKELGLINVRGTGNFKTPHSNHFLDKNAAEYFYDMMEAFVDQYGSKDIFLRNAYYCDYSEEIPHANIHATGYAIDLQIMNDRGQYSLKSNSEYYNWFVDNCYKYGYIFTGDTQNTNTSSGYSTFRFVGTAHSECMKVYSMDLEQYLSYVTSRTPDSCLRVTDEYGVEWMIYYVKASSGETTDVTVFGDESCYEISGDNLGGFVVTINASKLG